MSFTSSQWLLSSGVEPHRVPIPTLPSIAWPADTLLAASLKFALTLKPNPPTFVFIANIQLDVPELYPLH